LFYALNPLFFGYACDDFYVFANVIFYYSVGIYYSSVNFFLIVVACANTFAYANKQKQQTKTITCSATSLPLQWENENNKKQQKNNKKKQTKQTKKNKIKI
jgi:hypothetical protein